MKLYFAPDACSLSPHIVLRELGLPFTPVMVDTKTKRMANGGDYWAVNPKGYVPTLEFDDGTRLTEGPAIVQYLADRHPRAGLVPANGTFERARLHEWLNFISTEIHKTFSPLFNPALPENARHVFIERLGQRFGFVASTLEKQNYLLDDHFTVADIYLFVVTRWAPNFGIDLQRWPALAKYMQRIGDREAVKDALAAEAQLKKAA